MSAIQSYSRPFLFGAGYNRIDQLALMDLPMNNRIAPPQMEVLTDPEELARARAQRDRFDRNAAWLHKHAAEIYPRHRGKFICIARQELFVADTAEEALALAAQTHPEDDGSFLHYIPRERVPRIYADSG